MERVRTPRRAKVRVSVPSVVLGLLLSSAACGKRPDGSSSPNGGARTSSAAARTGTTADRGGARLPPRRDDTRFIQIRNLLEKDPESMDRATRLYNLVEPICTDEKERAEFIEVAKWSASFSVGYDRLPTVLALDTIEHVATSCARNHFEGALDVVARAREAVPDPYRHDLVFARLRAANGDLDESLRASRAAAEHGSVHALALTANIEAQIARGKNAGYTPGMFDEAIRAVSVEPSEKWSLIDLTAVLSTRGHLLNERSIWEPTVRAVETRRAAAEAFQRLSVAPFIEATRTMALDMLCFDSVEIGDPAGKSPCRRAAMEMGNLGGAVVARVVTDAQRIDRDRLAKLQMLSQDLGSLPKGATVVVGVRGDESELVTWVRPASKILERITQSGANIVFYDRTKSPRASALATRMLELAKAKPVETIKKADILAMGCLAATLAGRQTPSSCGIEQKTFARIERMPKLTLAVLIGRDLDAEIDDLKLYGHRTVLLSFRQTQIEKGLDSWLKSLSDVWIVAPPTDSRSP